MKKLLVLVFSLVCFATNTFAQDCKHVDETTDAFTNKTTKSAKITIGKGGTKWLIEFNQSEGVTTMKWGIAMVGEYNQQFDKGTKLLLKLENGTVLTLATTEASAPVTQAVNGGAYGVAIFSTYYLKYDLSKESLTSLSGSPIADFKIDIPDQKIKNPNMTDKQTEKIKDVCTCLKG
ncbi:MAG: hypothetical protein P4L41_13525 [Flavipsychrobacter sp.]|nr:hypothetical protein [Flavipsychrobacter sp.]